MHVAERSPEMVRVEFAVAGEDYSHEIRTDQFLKTAGAWRQGAIYIWIIGRVKAFIGRRTTIELVQKILDTMPDEDAMEAMGPKLESLDRHGYIRQR